MIEISKSDWKLFRERVGSWQEHYMEKLLKQYIDIIGAPGKAYERFWELERIIMEDRKHPGVILDLRKSDAICDIVALIKQKVITMEELDGFSEGLVDAVKQMVSRF